MNIFKTFEIFLKEPLSILKDNFIQIVSIQTGNIFENTVQNMTGITVSKVNVHVAGIVFPQTAPATVEE